MAFHVPEDFRIKSGPLATNVLDGNNGAFSVLSSVVGRTLLIIASDGLNWEHVSVHAEQGSRQRTPTWAEMCQVKALFWDDDDVVMQLHPRQSAYVNNHLNVLHLWRPMCSALPEPPSILVGYRSLGVLDGEAGR